MTDTDTDTDTGTGHRVAVIGDVGGHVTELRSELLRLGADPDHGTLPPDLSVVQVGDLIHRGPDSAAVITLVDRFLRRHPDRWHQLIGNHEAQYLRPPAFDWPEQLDPDSVATLRGWWTAGLARVATSVRSRHDEAFLITHAGLTCGFWRAVLDRLRHAEAAAAALNSLIGAHEDVLFHPGQMLGGGRPDPLAGPLWAAAATELVPSWLGLHLPFSQIHGHSRVLSGQPGNTLADQVRDRTVLDRPARHEITTLDGGRIVGVDPGHGRRPSRGWHSYLIETALPESAPS